ncbi:MAG: glycogen debranching N-terminal domain-containing protein, partial [Longimicrobiales bacterium]
MNRVMPANAAVASLLLPAASQRTDIRYAWRGPSMFAVEPDGRAGGHSLTGYFFRQARFLRDLRLYVCGEPPHPCSIAEVAPNELELTYIHPEVTKGGGGGSGSGGLESAGGLLFRNLDLRVRYVVRPSSLDVTLLITSRWQDHIDIDLAWLLSADYASIDEAQFGVREQNAGVETESVANGVAFRYTHPELRFETRVVGSGADWRFDGARLNAAIELPRQQVTELRLRVEAIDDADPMDAGESARREAKLEHWYAGIAALHTPGDTPFA